MRWLKVLNASATETAFPGGKKKERERECESRADLSTGLHAQAKAVARSVDSELSFRALAENWNIYLFANDLSLRVKTQLKEISVNRSEKEDVMLCVRKKVVSCRSGACDEGVAVSFVDDQSASCDSGVPIKPVARLEKWNLYRAPAVDAMIKVIFRASSFALENGDDNKARLTVRGKIKAALNWESGDAAKPSVLTINET